MDEIRVPDLPVSIKPWGEGFHLDAEISSEWVDCIANAGDVPIELRTALAASLRGLLISRAGLWIDRESPQRNWRTRIQLRDELSALRSSAAGGELPRVPEQLRLELRALEYRRRTGTPYGYLPPAIAPTEAGRWPFFMKLTTTLRHLAEILPHSLGSWPMPSISW